MGLATNVSWTCPGCGSEETTQIHGEWGDPAVFPADAVPSQRSLKWNDPCEQCGQYELLGPPETLVKYLAVKVKYQAVKVQEEDTEES